MTIEWDEQKREANIAKHRIDFRDISIIFERDYIEVQDPREYDEVRLRLIGRLGDAVEDLVYVVYT